MHKKIRGRGDDVEMDSEVIKIVMMKMIQIIMMKMIQIVMMKMIMLR